MSTVCASVNCLNYKVSELNKKLNTVSLKKGPRGPQGPPGPQGQPGPQGPPCPQGPTGSNQDDSLISHLQQYSNAMICKGICIEDRTAALVPSSNFPPLTTDTFPASWPNTSYPHNSIRVFNYISGNVPGKPWVTWAVQNNIKILIGIDLQNYTADLNALSYDYLEANTVLKQKYDNNVLAYAVGNEANTPEINTMNMGMIYAKNLISSNLLPNKPVSTVLNLNPQWISNTFPPENAIFTDDFKQLYPNMDVIMFNAYGGYFTYGDIDPSLTVQQVLELSLSWTSNSQQSSILLNQFGSVRAAMEKINSTHEFWITETGWSSAPLSNHPEPEGWSSLKNFTTFYNNFFNFNTKKPFIPQLSTHEVLPPERIFLFALRDSFLPLLNVEEFFGLYTKSPQLVVKI